MAKGTDPCPAVGCSRLVPPRVFACDTHMSRIPPWLRRALTAVQQEGPTRETGPTTAYRLVAARCRLAIAEVEEKPPETIADLRALVCRHALAPHDPELRAQVSAQSTEAELVAVVDEALMRLRTPSIHGKGGRPLGDGKRC